MLRNKGLTALLVDYMALLAFSSITLRNTLDSPFGVFVANTGYMPLSTYAFPWLISLLWALGHLAIGYIAIDGSMKRKPLAYRIIALLLGIILPLILLFAGISWLSNTRVRSWLYYFAGVTFVPIATYAVTLAKRKTQT